MIIKMAIWQVYDTNENKLQQLLQMLEDHREETEAAMVAMQEELQRNHCIQATISSSVSFIQLLCGHDGPQNMLIALLVHLLKTI